MSNIMRWSPQQQRITKALELVQHPETKPKLREIGPSSAPHQEVQILRNAATIALARLCPVHKLPYAAYYRVEPDGRTWHTTCGALTHGGAEELRTRQQFIVNVSQFGMERCYWCGASGYGALQCGNCLIFGCYGTSNGQQFTCGNCGLTANIVLGYLKQGGILL